MPGTGLRRGYLEPLGREMFLIKLSDLAEISPQINSNTEGAGGQMASSSTQEGREPGEQCLSHKHCPSF